ncbi:MAG: DUF1722 domain-containing protein, partial [Clostridiales bacterium]|nr:DUF1722 domain-containing protein [Clostridiales bacterium]
YYHAVRGRELDIMLEVKDKNRSAVKCINATRETPHIKYLEAEWARYKYAVLEHDPNAYLALRTLLKDKQAYPWREFYATIEQALRSEADPGNARNAAQHVWGYFKDIADEREKRQMLALLDAAAQGEGSFRTVKRKLYRLAEKYRQEFLLRSYYFMDSV